jgi:hypothetical protein
VLSNIAAKLWSLYSLVLLLSLVSHLSVYTRSNLFVDSSPTLDRHPNRESERRRSSTTLPLNSLLKKNPLVDQSRPLFYYQPQMPCTGEVSFGVGDGGSVTVATTVSSSELSSAVICHKNSAPCPNNCPPTEPQGAELRPAGVNGVILEGPSVLVAPSLPGSVTVPVAPNPLAAQNDAQSNSRIRTPVGFSLSDILKRIAVTSECQQAKNFALFSHPVPQPSTQLYCSMPSIHFRVKNWTMTVGWTCAPAGCI